MIYEESFEYMCLGIFMVFRGKKGGRKVQSFKWLILILSTFEREFYRSATDIP